MILAKGLSKKRFSIVFTFATSLVTFSLLKLAVLQRRKWEGGESLQQQHSGENLLEKEELASLPEVLRIDNWPEGLRFAQWNHTGEKVPKEFQHSWVALLKELLPEPCNIVDIGAHGGDTSIPLALVARGGKVVAFEMGPPFHMLRINQRLNPELNMDIYNLAIYDKNGTVFYEGSECDGCNGGINAEEEGIPVEAVALVPFLLQRYSREFVQNICMVKIDTEGYDPFILQSFPPLFRPKIIWTEWYAAFELESAHDKKSGCTDQSSSFFSICRSLGYNIYKTELPLEASACSSYQPDLLLMTDETANQVNMEAKIKVVSMSPAVLV